MFYGRGQRKQKNDYRRPGEPSTESIAVGGKTSDISDELIAEYKNKTKNPVSVVQEYCATKKLVVSYTEEFGAITTYGGFGCRCTIGGAAYEPGYGSTKKAAKTDAAIKAIEHILKYGRIIAKKEAVAEDEINEKHPVSILYEYGAKHKLNITISDDGKMDQGFRASVYSNSRLICFEYAHNKQEAKKKAGALALSIFVKHEGETNETHFDIMERLVLTELNRRNNLRLPTYRFAAFIILANANDTGTCVSLATGDCCPSDETSIDGRMIIDGHAIVMARRSFLKYLYGQLNLCLDNKESIFEWQGEKKRFCLKQSVSVHFYTSHAPCGDALAFSDNSPTLISQQEWDKMVSGIHRPKFEDKNLHGKLRQKGNEGTFTVGLERSTSYRLMSCSDKMLKWMLVGVQGALLTSYVEPIYINSVTLGNHFEIETLVRAICCRYDDNVMAEKLRDLPFRCHHPFVGRVSCYDLNLKERVIHHATTDRMDLLEHQLDQLDVDQTLPDRMAGDLENAYSNERSVAVREFDSLGLNACAFDDKVEIIDIKNTGRIFHKSPFQSGKRRASRLCKAAFLHRYRQLLQRVNPQLHQRLQDKNYLQAKRCCAEYEKAKERFEEVLVQDGAAKWVHQPTKIQLFVE